jgi:hypothetical protein
LREVVVGWMDEVVEETTGEHEGKEGAWRGRRRFMVEKIDDAVFHCVLEKEERGGHCIADEERRGRADRRTYKMAILVFHPFVKWGLGQKTCPECRVFFPEAVER